MVSMVKRGERQTLVKLRDDLLFLTCYLLTIEVTNVKIATMHATAAGGDPRLRRSEDHPRRDPTALIVTI